MTDDILNERANQRNLNIMKARGRIKKARRWLDHPRRRVRPKSRRGQIILGWVADQARLAYPADPESAVRRLCREFAPRLTEAAIDELIVASETSNKTWSNDQCAVTLGISFDDNLEIGFRFIGCNDDPNYDRRREREDAMSAVYSRRYRAKNGASTKRGRPRLDLSEADKEVRRALDAERKRLSRAAKSSGRPRGRPKSEGKCVQNNSSGYKIKNIKSDEFSRTHFSNASASDQPLASGAHQAPPSLAPVPVLVLEREVVPDGGDDTGVGFMPPPPPRQIILKQAGV